MKYEIVGSDISEIPMKIFMKLWNQGNESMCFIGTDVECRISQKNSIISHLTDPEVMIEYCLYPLLKTEGNRVVVTIKDNIERLSNSNNIIDVFQAIRFIYAQNNLIKQYEELPFIIDFKDCISKLRLKTNDMKKMMEDYRDGDFAKFRKNMYQMSDNMLRKCEVQM